MLCTSSAPATTIPTSCSSRTWSSSGNRWPGSGRFGRGAARLPRVAQGDRPRRDDPLRLGPQYIADAGINESEVARDVLAVIPWAGPSPNVSRSASCARSGSGQSVPPALPIPSGSLNASSISPPEQVRADAAERAA